MDLFEVPIIRPTKHFGDSLIEEPSSPSNLHISNSSSLSSDRVIDSYIYTEKCENQLETEEFKTETLNKEITFTEFSDLKPDETSKIQNFSETPQNHPKNVFQFIEYTEFSTQKVEKTQECEDTRYEIALNTSQRQKSSQTPNDFFYISSPHTIVEAEIPGRSESPTIKQERTRKINDLQRTPRLDLHVVTKTEQKRRSTEKKELNFTVPVVISPETRSPRASKEGFGFTTRVSEPYYPSLGFTERISESYYPRVEYGIIEDEFFSAKKRIGFLQLEMEKANQRLQYLKNEIIVNEKNNFIERSQKLSEINYTSMKTEVLELKNENLQKENEMLQEMYQELIKQGKQGKTVKKGQEKSLDFEEPKKNEVKSVEKAESLAEQKETIERELRKLGITSQRRAILTSRLQELTTLLENSKERPRLPKLF